MVSVHEHAEYPGEGIRPSGEGIRRGPPIEIEQTESADAAFWRMLDGRSPLVGGFHFEARSELPRPEPEVNSEFDALGEKNEELRRRMQAEDIQAGKEKGESYLRRSLQVAGETLDAAHEALTRHTKHTGGHLSKEAVRATINALQNQAMWDELLRVHHLADNDAAKAAVRQLTLYVKDIPEDEDFSDSLPGLLDQIDFLRKEIDIALHHTEAPLSPGFVQECMEAASSVASEVMVGLMAASASAEVAGGRLVPEVIYTAVGLAVAASVKQLFKRSASKFRAHTVVTQLQKYHDELIQSVNQLYAFLG